MSWSIPGPKRTKLREILSDRFTRTEVAIAIADLELEDPGYPEEMDDTEWFFKIVVDLERTRQLPKLADALAQRLQQLNPDDDDAAALRNIATREAPKPGIAGRDPPAVPTRADGAATPPEPAPPINDSSSPVMTAALAGIIVLGEPIAVSEDDTVAARDKLVTQLAANFADKDVRVTDWGDRWDTKRGATVQPGDGNFLFIRVVNNDTLLGDIDSLNAVPARIGRKLGMKGPIALSQVMVWICDAPQSDQVRPTDTGLAFRFGQPDIFAASLKAKFGFEKSPPVISLENPGANRALEEKLISFVSARTASVCRPPDPQLVYLEAVSGDKDATTVAELRQLLNTEVSRGGVIIAIHDLNLAMTDNPESALLQFKDRVAKYDKLLAPILKEQGFPDKKILKIAVVMNLRDALPLGQFPYKRMTKDWIVVGMKTVEDAAVLIRDPDEGLITRGIDNLLGQS